MTREQELIIRGRRQLVPIRGNAWHGKPKLEEDLQEIRDTRIARWQGQTSSLSSSNDND